MSNPEITRALQGLAPFLPEGEEVPRRDAIRIVNSINKEKIPNETKFFVNTVVYRSLSKNEAGDVVVY